MRFRLLPTFGLGLLLCSVSFRALAQEHEPPALTGARGQPAADLPPPGARTTHLVAGAVTTAISYGLAVGASYLYADSRGAKDLRVPVAGPWLALGRTGCAANEPDCSPVLLVLGAVLTLFDGVTQVGGLAIIGEGLFLKTSSARAAPKRAAGPTFRAIPLDLGKDGVGLGVAGTF